MPSARRRTRSRNAARAASGGSVVERRIQPDPRAAEHLGQQDLGVQPGRIGAVTLQIVGGPREQASDGPRLVFCHLRNDSQKPRSLPSLEEPVAIIGAGLRQCNGTGCGTPSHDCLACRPAAGRSLAMSGRPTTRSTVPRGSTSNASKSPRWRCNHTRRTVYTSSAKNGFTDFRAPCATIAHATNTLSTTVYAKVVTAPSKTAYLRIPPFPPIRSGSNNREHGRPRRRDPTGGQHERVIRCLAFASSLRGPRNTRSTRGEGPSRSCGVPQAPRSGSIIPTSSPLSRGRGPSQPRNRASRLATLRSRAVVSRREPPDVNRENATGRRREGEEERQHLFPRRSHARLPHSRFRPIAFSRSLHLVFAASPLHRGNRGGYAARGRRIDPPDRACYHRRTVSIGSIDRAKRYRGGFVDDVSQSRSIKRWPRPPTTGAIFSRPPRRPWPGRRWSRRGPCGGTNPARSGRHLQDPQLQPQDGLPPAGQDRAS